MIATVILLLVAAAALRFRCVRLELAFRLISVSNLLVDVAERLIMGGQRR